MRGGCAAAPSAGGAGAVRRGAGGVRATCARPAAVRGRSARSRSPSGGVPWGPRGCAHRRLPPLEVAAPRVASPPVAPPPVAPLPVAPPLVDDREEVAPPSGGGYAHTRPRAADQWSAAAGVPRAEATRGVRGAADEAGGGRARVGRRPPDPRRHPAREEHGRPARVPREGLENHLPRGADRRQKGEEGDNAGEEWAAGVRPPLRRPPRDHQRTGCRKIRRGVPKLNSTWPIPCRPSLRPRRYL